MAASPMATNDRLLKAALDQRRSEAGFRELTLSDGLVDFISNDYLGLAKEPCNLKTERQGSGGSRLLSGNLHHHRDLERLLTSYYRAEEALLFHSGFEANYGLFSMLGALGYRVIYDEEMHASVRSGLIGARNSAWSFKHNDLNALEAKLQRSDLPTVVVTESVFSMSGEVGELAGIAELKSRYEFVFVVDEAHGTGTVGGFGGLSEQLGLIDAVDLRLHTFGKAIGASGACWVGRKVWMDGLVNFCRPFIYSTAPSPVLLELIKKAHERFRDQYQERNLQLQALIDAWKVCAKDRKGFSQNPSPIQFIRTSSAEKTVMLAGKLKQGGFGVAGIRQPTVPPGQERLRVSLHSFNTNSELDKMLCELM